MRWPRAWAIRELVLVLIGTAAGAGSARLSAQSTPTGEFEAAMSYYLAGGGAWRQDNEDFEGEADQPVYWIRAMKWGPERSVVTADAFAVFESRRCEAVVHMVYYWDRVQRRVVTTGFGAQGILAEGYVESLGPYRDRVVGSIRLADGTEARFRDTSDRTNPDEYSTSAERWDGDEWTPSGGAHWVRDSEGAPCG